MKVKFHYNHKINADIDTDKPVNVYIDRLPPDNSVPEGSVCIVILEEPFRGHLYETVNHIQDRYTHLLTFDDWLLETNPKAQLFQCTNSWVKGYVSPKKQFSVSTVVGGKSKPTMLGYATRHNLWKCKELIRIPKAFYLSSQTRFQGADYKNNLVLGKELSGKKVLFDSMFHIAIENTAIGNYFTEKIIDCFQTRTVPVYWGCTNIGEYFNADGILKARNVGEIIKICNGLTPEVYENMKEVMEENYKESEKWCDGHKTIIDKVKELIK